ncbi:GntR family transcriptional regulator [Alphaproteobacteria bacterium]|nr:GntR family transcriptional regulator [Alphaproteobacteria bacterium]
MRCRPLPELAIRFGVSIVTIRQAIEMLSKDGLVVSQRGRGPLSSWN